MAPTFLGKAASFSGGGGTLEIDVPTGSVLLVATNAFSIGTQIATGFDIAWGTYPGYAWISSASDDAGNDWGYASSGLYGDTTPYYDDDQPYETFAFHPCCYVTNALFIGDAITFGYSFFIPAHGTPYDSNDPPTVAGVGEVLAFSGVPLDQDFFPGDGPRGILVSDMPSVAYTGGDADAPPPDPGVRIPLPLYWMSAVGGGSILAGIPDQGYYANDGSWHASFIPGTTGALTAGYDPARTCDTLSGPFFDSAPSGAIAVGAVSQTASNPEAGIAYRSNTMAPPRGTIDPAPGPVGPGSGTWCDYDPWILVDEESDGDTDSFCAYFIKTSDDAISPFLINGQWDIGTRDVGPIFTPGPPPSYVNPTDGWIQVTPQSGVVGGLAWVEQYLGQLFAGRQRFDVKIT